MEKKFVVFYVALDGKLRYRQNQTAEMVLDQFAPGNDEYATVKHFTETVERVDDFLVTKYNAISCYENI